MVLGINNLGLMVFIFGDKKMAVLKNADLDTYFGYFIYPHCPVLPFIV